MDLLSGLLTAAAGALWLVSSVKWLHSSRVELPYIKVGQPDAIVVNDGKERGHGVDSQGYVAVLGLTWNPQEVAGYFETQAKANRSASLWSAAAALASLFAAFAMLI